MSALYAQNSWLKTSLNPDPRAIVTFKFYKLYNNIEQQKNNPHELNTAPPQDLGTEDGFILLITDDFTSTLTPPPQQCTWTVSPKTLTNWTWDIYCFSPLDFRNSTWFPELNVCLAHKPGMFSAFIQNINPCIPIIKGKTCRGCYYLWHSKNKWRLLLFTGGNWVQPLSSWRQDAPLTGAFSFPHVTCHHDHLPCLWQWQQWPPLLLGYKQKSLTFTHILLNWKFIPSNRITSGFPILNQEIYQDIVIKI